MEGNIGVKLKSEVKKTPVFLTGLLAMILVIAYTFTLKTYEPAKNILISGGVTVYPLTFLIIALISKNYGFKEARKSIFISALLYVTFMLLVMISVIPKSNVVTSGYNTVIQYLFTNNFFDIGETSIFYPMLGQFFGILIAYVVSHLIYAALYNALKGFTIDYLAVGLGLFISYIIDRIIFMPLLYAEGLMNGSNTFDYFIKCLTSEFVAAIACSLIIVIVYMIINAIKKKVKRKA